MSYLGIGLDNELRHEIRHKFIRGSLETHSDRHTTVLPLQVGVMSRQNVFHQGDRLAVGRFSQLLGKIEFGTQEVADRPQPLLHTNTRIIIWVHFAKRDRFNLQTVSSADWAQVYSLSHGNKNGYVCRILFWIPCSACPLRGLARRRVFTKYSLALGGSWILLPGCSCHYPERCHKHRSTPCHWEDGTDMSVDLLTQRLKEFAATKTLLFVFFYTPGCNSVILPFDFS